MSNEGFSNDSSWKAFKLTLKFIWWCIKALIAVIGFVFVKWYKNRKLEKAEEKRLRAEQEAAAARARVEEARAEAAQAETAVTEAQQIVEQKIGETEEELKEKITE